MRILKQLGVVLLGSALAAAMVTLGVWQIRVYNAQGADAAAERAAGPPVALAPVAPPGQPVRYGYGRLVGFDGRYLPEHELLVPLPDDPTRLRVLTAFLTDTGPVVAVVRGVVPAPSGTAAAAIPAPPSGRIGQNGVLLPSEEAVPGLSAPGRLASVRVPALAQQWPQPLLDGYVVLSAADATAQGIEPAPLALPEARGRLRNGAYALQWWIFAGFALVLAARVAKDIGDPDEIRPSRAAGAT